MQDIIAKREQYLTEAAECELIRDLATDPKKRELFGRLAHDLRKMVADLDAAVAAAQAPLVRLFAEVKWRYRLRVCEVPLGTDRSPNCYSGMSPHHMKTLAIALIVATVGLPLASAGWVAAALLTF